MCQLVIKSVLHHLTHGVTMKLFMVFMLMSVVGVEFGAAVGRHNVCSSYVCAVC